MCFVKMFRKKSLNSSFRTYSRTIQKPLKFDIKGFETNMKTPLFKNTTLELGASIGKQTKNRS